MNRLFNEEKIRRVVITMYGNDLLDQWATQMRKEFLTKQINYHYGSRKMMNNFIMHPDNSLLLVSRDSGNLTRLLNLLDRAPGNYAKDTLFIFDEVHGAGSSTLVENLSGRISPYQYRLGFQVLNDRGAGLTEGDLLKSKTLEVLEKHFSIKQASIETAWDEILQDEPKQVEQFLRYYYASVCGNRVGRTTLYDDFLTARVFSQQPKNNIWIHVLKKTLKIGINSCPIFSHGVTQS